MVDLHTHNVIVKLAFNYGEDYEDDLVNIVVPYDVSVEDVKKAIKETDDFLRNADGEYMDSIYANSGCCTGTLMDEVNKRYKWEWNIISEDFTFEVD